MLTYVKSALDIPNKTIENHNNLSNLYDTIIKHLRSQKSLDKPTKH